MNAYLPPFGDSVKRHAQHKADSAFEIFGYFEETILPEGKAATWKIETVPYKLGVNGAYQRNFKKGDVLMIQKGHKPDAPYKFKQDVTLQITSHALCGPMKNRK